MLDRSILLPSLEGVAYVGVLWGPVAQPPVIHPTAVPEGYPCVGCVHPPVVACMHWWLGQASSVAGSEVWL